MAATNVQRFSGDVILSGNMNLQKVSNTATIKLDSNVVVEFPRSKKLIKYPRVALTAASQGGYVTSSSTTAGTYYTWKAFDTNLSDDSSVWTTVDNIYDSNDNYAYDSDKSLGEVTGEWLKIELPNKIKPSYVRIYPRTYSPPIGNNQSPEDFKILASIDDTNWVELTSVVGWVTSATWGKWDIPSETPYKYFAIVCTRTIGSATFGIAELEYYGTPEYDPEAHGTDVTVKSYPNVPNTDWLERYYDAKNYSSGSTILDELTATHRDATINGSVPLDTSSGINSWSFNGNASNFISGDDNIDGIPAAGDWVHSMSIWFKTTDMSIAQNIAMILPSANVDGSTPATGSASAFYLRDKNTGTGPSQLQIVHWSQDVRINYIFNENEWYHLTYAYSGGGVSSASQHTYINGVHVPLLEDTRSSSTIGDPLNISSVSRVVLGKRYLTGNDKPFTGSIANFRLFNRTLSSDEIYQLYAHQKEYFGHGDLSMTLKAGRLGIGTSEPRAALDVRGDIMGGCPVYFSVQCSTNAGPGIIPWDDVLISRGGGFNSGNGIFTVPLSGVYSFSYTLRERNSDANLSTNLQINGVDDYTARTYHRSNYSQSSVTFIRRMAQGDTISIFLVGGDMQGGIYNQFTGQYISSV